MLTLRHQQLSDLCRLSSLYSLATVALSHSYRTQKNVWMCKHTGLENHIPSAIRTRKPNDLTPYTTLLPYSGSYYVNTWNKKHNYTQPCPPQIINHQVLNLDPCANHKTKWWNRAAIAMWSAIMFAADSQFLYEL